MSDYVDWDAFEDWRQYLALLGFNRFFSENKILLMSIVFFALRNFPLFFSNCVALLVFLVSVAAFQQEREDCPICCEKRYTLMIVTNACGHKCCRRCLRRYLETELDALISRLRRARRFTIRCFGGCEQLLGKTTTFIIIFTTR